MALIKCRECGKMISDEAGACPQCGKPVEIIRETPPAQEKKGPGKLIAGIIIIFIIAGCGWYVYTYLNSDIKDGKKDILDTFRSSKKEEEKEAVVLADTSVPVDEDEYYAFTAEITKKSAVTVEYSIISGPEVDMFTLTESQYAVWKKSKKHEEGSVTPVSGLSESGKNKGTFSAEVPAGTYFVIVDNTNYGKCAPPTNTVNDQANVQVKITVLEK